MKLAIIPARGGSKRIARKNIKLFHGQPLLAYSIAAAKASGEFDRIIVSTDDAEIASLAESLGAEVPFIRPAHLSGDHTATIDVIQHAIQTLQDQGHCFDFVCCIYATAPFLQASFLSQGLQHLINCPSASYAFSVTTFAFPVQRAICLDESGRVGALYPEFRNTRSQDLPEALHDAGQFYWGRCDAWLRGDAIFSACSLPVRLPRYLVQDIDSPEDWQVAEHMFAAILANKAIQS